MSVNTLARTAGSFLRNNSPTIAAIGAVAGVGATAYLVGSASFKAAKILDDHKESHPNESLTTKERVEKVWRLYIPASIALSATVLCIVTQNRLAAQRISALVSLYTVTERAYNEYRDKVVERIGDKSSKDILDEISQDRVTENPPVNKEVYITGHGDVLCQDCTTGRYFEANMEALRKAQNDVNYQLQYDIAVSLTEFYNLIGLEPTSFSYAVGWLPEKPLDIHFTTALTEDGRPCICVNYDVVRIPDHVWS